MFGLLTMGSSTMEQGRPGLGFQKQADGTSSWRGSVGTKRVMIATVPCSERREHDVGDRLPATNILA